VARARAGRHFVCGCGGGWWCTPCAGVRARARGGAGVWRRPPAGSRRCRRYAHAGGRGVTAAADGGSAFEGETPRLTRSHAAEKQQPGTQRRRARRSRRCGPRFIFSPRRCCRASEAVTAGAGVGSDSFVVLVR